MEGRKVKSVCTTCRGKGCDRCDGDGYIFVKVIPAVPEEVEETKVRRPLSYYNSSLKLKYLPKIVEAIRKFQSAYMERGDVTKLLPMTLKDISKLTKLNTSIICRATQGEKIDGTLIKDLFGTTVDGQSNKVIMGKIKELIYKENPAVPLSDQKLKELLDKSGLNVARRTVAKYRRRMGISSAPERLISGV